MKSTVQTLLLKTIETEGWQDKIHGVILSQQIAKGRQDVSAEILLSLKTENNEYKVKLNIHSDSYDFQSYAIASVWSPVALKWERVTSIPFSHMKTPHGLVHRPDWNTETHFLKDYQELLVKVFKIL